ncbi:MAG: hypothetical protein ABF959_12695, partial [Gluconobacter albidus]
PGWFGYGTGITRLGGGSGWVRWGLAVGLVVATVMAIEASPYGYGGGYGGYGYAPGYAPGYYAAPSYSGVPPYTWGY